MSQQPYSPDPRQPSYPYTQQDYNATTERHVNQGHAQMQSQRQEYVDQAGNRVEKHHQVYKDPTQSMMNLRYITTSLTYFLLGVLEVILGLRFIFRLLGANQGSPFIDFLYNLSSPFVIIFNGIFNDQTIGSRSVLELSTLLAMLIYALIAWGLVSLFRIIFFPNVPSRGESMTMKRKNLS